EFLGRIDHQVKIRGFRIELGEIENQLLRYPLIKEAVVIDKKSSIGDKYLCAYIVTLPNRLITPIEDQLRKHLSKELPSYMIPSFFAPVDRIPMTPGGKPDHRSLPDPGFKTDKEYIAPRNETEKRLAKIWAEILVGQSAESISIDDKFFEVGGNSLTIIRLSSRLHQVFGKPAPVVTLFRCPTIRQQARFLTASNNDRPKNGPVGRKGAVTAMDVVVIGMAGRFPGARDIHEFQDNLEKGIECITFFNDRELEEAGIIPELLNNPNYIKARGFLQDADCFDAAFFDYSPGHAGLMDPQVRLFHECCWEALEDAGYVPDTYHGSIGLYAGASPNITWMMSNIQGEMSPSEQYELLNLNGPSFTTLVSYKLNLKGPALSIQTTCSTSLVAVDTACQSLLRGTCDMALAGGVFLHLPNTSGYRYQEGMILSPDGHCRTFDAKAAGTMTGNGVGIVVLKTLDRAIANGDHIYGVIKGSAINNDGQRKVGYTAPSVEGQAEVIRAALATAGLEPETIGYIEAHGTGTPLGDPVEIEGLKLAFNTTKRSYCGIGSVKSNIGHLDAAAGIAGLIKSLLILKHKKIPPTINCETPNPAIDFANSPFYINTRLQDWKQDRHPRRIGISSFGIGGTNAHLVLEEWSAPRDAEHTVHGTRSHQLILLSAKTEKALERSTQNLADYFKKNPGISLADAAYTLQQGRKTFKYRRILVSRDTAKAVALLTASTPNRVYSAAPAREDRPLVFMFPGQGSQYVNMGLELYEKEPVFRQEMDRCFEILKPLMGYDIKEILYPHSDCRGGSPCPPRDCAGSPLHSDRITQTEIAQPVLFAFEYALAKLLMSWGIRPTAMIGHSIGEYTAACLSRVFSLEDALEIVTKRGQLMQQLPSGAMLGVPLSENEIISLLENQKEVSLAAVNSTTRSVVSGPHEAVAAFEKTLQGRGYETQRLHTSHAFHSTMMNSILESFETTVRHIPRAEPQIPYISNVTGQWITGQEVENPGYWSRQLRETVRFADGLSQLFKKDQFLFFLEVGPGKTLTTLARQHAEKGDGHMVENLVCHPREKTPDLFLLLTRLGQLWLQGKQVDWSGFHGSSQRQRISLPCYPFERRSYNIDINITRETGNRRQISAAIADEAVTGGMEIPLEKKNNMAHWFYTPAWKRSRLVVRKPTETAEPLCYLVFTDSYPDGDEIPAGAGLGYGLVNQLKQAPGIREVIVVSRGSGFLKKTNNAYQIRPTRPDDYENLFYELYKQDRFPHKIVHLWSVIDNESPGEDGMAVDIRHVDEALDAYFYSLLYTARAIGKHHGTPPLDLSVVTPGMQDVTGAEPLNPQYAAVLGAAAVIPQEYPGINCRSIDVVVPPQETRLERLTTQLLAEISQINPDRADTVVAIRENHRWVRTFTPLRLEENIEEKPLLRQRGVYLVTGGLGEIGRVLAEYLTIQAKARLILIGRTPLPPKDRWSRWLDAHDAGDPVSRKISTLRHLEALGAEVLSPTADAANESQMEAVIQQAEQQFGCINGVFHAAYIGEKETYRTIREITREDCRSQFHPKIKGVLVLEKVLRKLKRKPDFCLLMSSLASILGGLGFAAYSAANAFLDAFTHHQNRAGDMPWISVNWDAWQLDSRDTHRFSPSVGSTLARLAVSKEEGMAVFERVLSWGEAGQIVHSTADLRTRLERSRNSAPVKNQKKQHSTRPYLSIPYTPPRNSLEHSLAGIWESFFGFKSLGIYDDFYELGGDSLKAVTIVSKIQSTLKVDIPLTILFDTPTIEGIAKYIANNSHGSSFSAIEPVEKREYYQLSSAQKRLFFSNRLENIGISYNMPFVFKFIGRLGKRAIEQTFHQLIQRHEILRTSFHLYEDKPIQKVHDKIDFEIEGYDFNNPCRFLRPFDLSLPPLMRVRIREISETRHFLLFDMHHIISDGLSIQVLMDELIEIYSGAQPPALKIQYKDFSTWQNHFFESSRIKTQEDYWLNRFADADEIPVLNLTGDYPRPPVFSFEGDRYRFKLGPREVSRFKELSAANEVTLTMNLMAAFNVLLYKYSGQSDIIVGSGMAGRRHVELQRVIGLFVNILAVSSQPAPDKTYLEFLKEVKKSNAQALENQDMQFENLVERLELKRDLSRNPLFDVCLVNLNYERSEKKLENLELVPIETEDVEDVENKTAKFDLTLFVYEIGNEIRFSLEFYTGIFKVETMRRLANHFINIIKQVSANPGIRLTDIDMLSNEEKHQLLYAFNDTFTHYPKDKTIPRLFAEQVEQRRDHIAVIGVGTRFIASDPGKLSMHITYDQLNEKSNQLAYLLKEKSVKPDTIVGIIAERSLEMIIGILGILKAGGAYLPIDPEYPRERIDFMLKDSGAEILLKDTDFTPEAFNNRPKGTSSHLHLSPAPATCLAYVMYTSGTTGKPKGILNTHYNVVRVVKNTNYIHIGEHDRVLQLSNYAFDGSVFDLYGALLNGSALFLVEKEEVLSIERLSKLIRDKAITLFFVTTALFNVLVKLNLQCLTDVRQILFGGERVSVEHARKALEYLGKNKVIHVYGPTETTVFASYYPIDVIKKRDVTIPIGSPLSNTSLYILNKDFSAQPIGVSGEIYIGGDGLARGYLNRVELTAEKFCLRRPGGTLFEKTAPPGPPRKNFLLGTKGIVQGTGKNHVQPCNHATMQLSPHHSPHYPIYKTGDLGKWLPDGNIEFLGRIDHQVKLRGFRIELGEIESQLLKHENIKQVVVIARTDKKGDNYLCAYIVPTDLSAVRAFSPIEKKLRQFSSQSLPHYMVPSYFVPLEKIPLNPNGKVDSRALPGPEFTGSREYVPPKNEIEKKLVRIWSEVLGRDASHEDPHQSPGYSYPAIGINDDFFELGGHSLRAATLAAKIHKELKVKIPLKEIFIARTIKELSKYIKETAPAQYASIEPTGEKEYYDVSSAQKRLYILQQMDLNNINYNITGAFLIETQPDRTKIEQTFRKVIERHESFRTSFAMVEDEPVQRIHDNVAFEIEYYGAGRRAQSAKHEAQSIERNKERCAPGAVRCASFIRPFDLSRAPLLRVGLIDTAEQKQILAVDMHHIISDGASMGVLIDDFMVLYEGNELPGLRTQYKDYSEWQKKEKETGASQQQKAYWQDQLAGEIPLLKLPTDYPRPRLQDFKGSTLYFEIEESETKELKSLALKQEVTLFMLLLSAYNILLARLCSEEDIIVGTPIAARRHADLRHTIGMFVNTLALRNKPSGEKTFRTFLKEIKEKTLAAFENQEYPFEDLVEKVSITRDASRNPLFDVMLVLQNVDLIKPEIPGLKLKPFEIENNISKFDITLQVVESGTKLFLACEYCTELFKKETIDRFIKYFMKIVSSVLDDPEQKISEIEILPEEEKQRILFEFND
ncbi:amino acid adenylation domain-containing protein, partial [Acidobacteriota bacterium]